MLRNHLDGDYIIYCIRSIVRCTLLELLSMYRHVARTNAISKFRSRPLLKTSKGAHLARCLGSVGKTTVLSNDTPFRKLLKDEAKRRRILGEKKGVRDDTPCSNRWELTVGIEVHAQLNTDRKLFSSW